MPQAALVADSAAYQRKILRLLLRDAGVGVAGEAGHWDAAGAVEGGRIAFVDAALPGRPAWDEIVRTLAPARVVATGAPADDAALAEAVEAGVGTILVKPYTAGTVAAALSETSDSGPAGETAAPASAPGTA